MLRRADGRRYGALRALDAGLRIIEEYQASRGAAELRAHVSAHRGALTRVGLRMAVEAGAARAAYRWIERGRAISLRLRPAHPPDDAVLAQLLTDLRVTMAAIESGHGRAGAAALIARQVALERQIRDHCRKVTGEKGVDHSPDISDVVAHLGSAALVEYLEVDDEIHAVTVADGCVGLHRLGPLSVVRDGMRHLPFALHRLADGASTPAGVAASAAVLDRVRGVFDAALLRPLGGVVRDRPLVIVPSEHLQSLPWSVLPSCTGRPVTVVPSATLWARVNGRPAADANGRVVVVAGPGLPGALAEAASVADLYETPTRLFGAAATARQVSAAMAGAGLVHVAAHGVLRSDNPLFSALVFTDGPYTVYDLELLANAPQQVVLAACDSGRAQVVAGEEVLGLTSALLSHGTVTLVAPVVPVPDGETSSLMHAYHVELVSGRAPAEALAIAQERTRTEGPLALAAAAGFVCLGASRPVAGRPATT
jgi:hypothetical protein